MPSCPSLSLRVPVAAVVLVAKPVPSLSSLQTIASRVVAAPSESVVREREHLRVREITWKGSRCWRRNQPRRRALPSGNATAAAEIHCRLRQKIFYDAFGLRVC
ncbi:uncharacterized protein LOC127743144 isoform X2 [Arachis duranensis]|uniref:Uncharacterized protein LOC127743144 isoform X2 n=1 Tax=Arachis duranensis TaxID=130453 RepID=A0A9C6TMJ5_ARADU|nr:uncharacterized protein LOC127743144 isoform X2 [Arachis duranensis]